MFIHFGKVYVRNRGLQAMSAESLNWCLIGQVSECMVFTHLLIRKLRWDSSRLVLRLTTSETFL